ncbi:MAG: transposase [Spirochaetaceae bacterium]|nr:transposase [Spirochaetaceae bacterium]
MYIEYKDAGHTFKEVYEAFGVDSKRYYSKNELLHLLEEHPDWYLRKFAEKFNVCMQSVHKMFRKLGVTRKKTFTYSENQKKNEKSI